jgi:hypothetical protein
VVEVLGITRGDVTRDALLEPELGKDAETGREPQLAVEALLLDGLERGLVPAVVVGHLQFLLAQAAARERFPDGVARSITSQVTSGTPASLSRASTWPSSSRRGPWRP